MGFETNTACIIMKSSSFFSSEKLCFENGVCKPNWIRNGGYFVRYLSQFHSVCLLVVCVNLLQYRRILPCVAININAGSKRWAFKQTQVSALSFKFSV